MHQSTHMYIYIYIYTYIYSNSTNMYELYLTMASLFTVLTILCFSFLLVEGYDQLLPTMALSYFQVDQLQSEIREVWEPILGLQTKTPSNSNSQIWSAYHHSSGIYKKHTIFGRYLTRQFWPIGSTIYVCIYIYLSICLYTHTDIYIYIHNTQICVYIYL